MKKLLFTLGTCSLCTTMYTQVGIGTDQPTAMLDVVGQIRMRDADQITTSSTKTSKSVKQIITIDGDGYVKRGEVTEFVKMPRIFVRGCSKSKSTVLGLNLLSGWRTINFDNVASPGFNIGNGFDISTYQFTAPEDGIYNLYAQFTMDSSFLGLSANANTGIGIFITPVGTKSPTLIAEETFTSLNISVLGISLGNISSPIRKVSSVVSLNAGDKVAFGAKTVLSVSALSSVSPTSDTFFTISQIK
ncbi:hypothetical protein [Apibacter sp. HY039]|uniref:hypothetical protein n=1 Tax=Apibacter sp. HY039 TaxID=2501476 RepID=UPI000FEC2100|nr:hypothetical protein [Apibacter sp. HY039]